MSTDYCPGRRLRQKTCVPVGVAVPAQQLPGGGRSLSGGSVHIDCQGLRLDMNNIFRSFPGTDVLATVASFLGIRALGWFLALEKHVCGREDLWEILLRRVSRSVFAVRVRSARTSISKMMCRPYCVWPADWPADGYIPGEQLSNYRWCLDLCHRECQVFSAVIPVTKPSLSFHCAFRSLFRDDFTGRPRVANLLPLHRLPLPVLELMHDAWSQNEDPVLRSRAWRRGLQLRDEFHRGTMTCSLWLFDTRSREVVAGICRDAYWGAYSGIFRFYISEVFEWVGVDRDLDPVAANYMAGRVLEIWVPFKCTSNVEGAYDLSCSVEVFVADGTLYPDDPITGEVLRGRNPAEDPPLVWERRPATPWDLFFALSGCALRSAVPHVDV